ncbi:MAG: hypothetical protein JWM68_5049, partial [Verrucomicrobiales bacterium]|nr:hypothetical protein [Verrucomicrobiales bacterium]
MKRQSQRGVALVITLIMLSVITLLAVAFLAMSRRNKESVGNSQNQADAKEMANGGLARAQAEILNRALATLIGTNVIVDLLNFDLMVSTNYINIAGYEFIHQNEDPANINFDRYTTGGSPLANDDWIRNIGNLSYNPRVPVFVMTNRAFPNRLDFRFYLDLNRNGAFDTNGYGIVVGKNGYFDTNGVEIVGPLIPGNPYLSNYFIGDPEWIGILERPDRPHSGTNRFIGRFCYIVLPAGKTLDLNFIHNQAKRLGTANDGFFRNQEIGSWELNLAGFLADLNTNYWNTNTFPYAYNTNLVPFATAGSKGWSFDDAAELVKYRYSLTGKSANGDYDNLLRARFYYPTVPADFVTDGIDNYANGPLVVSNFLDESFIPNQDNIDTAWSGSDNTNSFFSLFDELFDTNRINPNAAAF